MRVMRKRVALEIGEDSGAVKRVLRASIRAVRLSLDGDCDMVSRQSCLV